MMLRWLIKPVLFSVIIFTIFPPSTITAQTSDEQIREINHLLVQKRDQYLQSTRPNFFNNMLQTLNLRPAPSEHASDMIDLAILRKRHLLNLIEENPQKVFPLLFDQATVTSFPDFLQTELEKPTIMQGQYMLAVIEDFENLKSKEQGLLSVGGQHLPLHFSTDPENIQINDTVKITGYSLQDNLLVDNNQDGSVEIIESQNIVSATGVARKAAAILFKFNSSTPDPYTQSRIKNILFNNSDSVANYFVENSYGQISGMTGEVYPQQGNWYVINGDTSKCDKLNWANLAKQRAIADGMNYSQYQHVMYMFPRTSICSWNGFAYYGSELSFMNGLDNSRIIAHEFGHNLGNNHAARLDCGSTTFKNLLSDCSFVEYGDITDTMGWAIYAEFNTPHKLQVGWIPYEKVQTITSPQGVYTVYASETPPSSTPVGSYQALKIVRINESNADYKNLYISYRQRQGLWDNKLPSATVQGISLHLWRDNSSRKKPHLLDTTPGSQSSHQDFYDASLTDGKSVYDAANQIYIRQISHDTQKATVEIILDPNLIPTSTPTPKPTFTPSPTPTNTPAMNFIETISAWGNVQSTSSLDHNLDGFVNFLDFQI